TEVEQQFHRAIARATHNEFMDRLMPVIFQAINQGVILSKRKEHVVEDTIRDHRLIMDFMKARNAEGARNAMRIHILHAMQDLGME
ncbi:MAG TPA: FCD domain-containing protein, partial [Pseudogracilibacillus sp.]|nr:FCD domain-containing protein [Pseudogracilibacillus sp.]